MKNECLICGAPLKYLENDQLMECAYTLPGSSAFLHLRASEVQDIGTANTEMHHKSKKVLVNQGLSAIF